MIDGENLLVDLCIHIALVNAISTVLASEFLILEYTLAYREKLLR